MERTAQGRSLALDDDVEDEELVARYRSGDAHAAELLLRRYRGFARMKVRSYFLVGGDREDIVQEALIGLYKAIRDFNLSGEHPFRAFADVCVTRQVITAIKGASRRKHAPLNSYVSLSGPADDEPGSSGLEVLDRSPEPGALVVSLDEVASIKDAFGSYLSRFESEVLRLYVEGKSYEQIASFLSRGVKAIDNAVQRVKRKVEAHVRGRNLREVDRAGAT